MACTVAISICMNVKIIFGFVISVLFSMLLKLIFLVSAACGSAEFYTGLVLCVY